MGTLGPTSSHDGVSESEGREPGVRVLCPEGSCSRRHPRGTPVPPGGVWPGPFLDPRLPPLGWPGSGRWAVQPETCSPSSGEGWRCPRCCYGLWDGPGLQGGPGVGGPYGWAVATRNSCMARPEASWAPGTPSWPLRNMSPAWWASGQLTPVCPPRAVPATLLPHTPSCQQGPATQP